jgi:hypothetical protein
LARDPAQPPPARKSLGFGLLPPLELLWIWSGGWPSPRRLQPPPAISGSKSSPLPSLLPIPSHQLLPIAPPAPTCSSSDPRRPSSDPQAAPASEVPSLFSLCLSDVGIFCMDLQIYSCALVGGLICSLLVIVLDVVLLHCGAVFPSCYFLLICLLCIIFAGVCGRFYLCKFSNSAKKFR